MGCACKNKIKKIENLADGYEYEYEKKGYKKILSILLKAFGRFVIAMILITILPFIMIFLLFRIVFLPEKQIVVNLNKLLKKWKKHTE